MPEVKYVKVIVPVITLQNRVEHTTPTEFYVPISSIVESLADQLDHDSGVTRKDYKDLVEQG
jgi:hypothetical protein